MTSGHPMDVKEDLDKLPAWGEVEPAVEFDVTGDSKERTFKDMVEEIGEALKNDGFTFALSILTPNIAGEGEEENRLNIIKLHGEKSEIYALMGNLNNYFETKKGHIFQQGEA